MVDAAPRAWQRMLSGRRLDLLDPSPLDIEIEDGVGQYRPQHVQLFKSVQKQLRLGRTLEEIKSLLVLPARRDSIVAPRKELLIPDELRPTSVKLKLKNPISVASTKAMPKQTRHLISVALILPIS